MHNMTLNYAIIAIDKVKDISFLEIRQINTRKINKLLNKIQCYFKRKQKSSFINEEQLEIPEVT